MSLSSSAGTKVVDAAACLDMLFVVGVVFVVATNELVQ